jgi:hypothetical protein
MKAKNTSFMAGLLITGMLGAADLIAANTIEHPISGANDAQISRIIAITNIHQISIDEIANDEIAIRNIINPEILDDRIDAGIAKIEA